MNPRIWRSYAFVFASLTAAPVPAQTVIVSSSASIPASTISAAGVIEEPDESTDQEPMKVEDAPQEAEPAKGKKEEKPTPRGERM